MIDSLAHIASVAQMEHRLPREKEDSTLWENDELTIRFLLEEGKLNLCLRQMAAYTSEMARRGPPSEWLAGAARELELGDAATLEARLLAFEQALGALHACAISRHLARACMHAALSRARRLTRTPRPPRAAQAS